MRLSIGARWAGRRSSIRVAVTRCGSRRDDTTSRWPFRPERTPGVVPPVCSSLSRWPFWASWPGCGRSRASVTAERDLGPLFLPEVLIHVTVTNVGPTMGAMAIRVFLVDDHELVRLGLRDAVSAEPDFDVVGEASTAAEAVDRLSEAAPDVAVVDIR